MRLVMSSVVVAALGCSSTDSADDVLATTGAIRSEVTTTNGTDLNGTDLNGTDLNGTDLNGTDLNGSRLASTLAAAHLAGAKLNGVPVTAWLERGELRAVNSSGTTFVGTALVGLLLDGEIADGSFVKLLVNSAADSGGGVWRYDFFYGSGGNGTWTPVCGNGAAVVVPGRWNYQEGVAGGGAFTADSSVFTVGCPYAAVEKCVRLGYRPWQQFGGISGVEFLTSCVRAIRADYCGDGVSHTTDGRLINIYDGVGVQADTEDWTIEAEWVPGGASCVSAVARDLLGITCSTVPATLSCGDPSHFGSGTRLMTETPLGPVSL